MKTTLDELTLNDILLAMLKNNIREIVIIDEHSENPDQICQAKITEKYGAITIIQ